MTDLPTFDVLSRRLSTLVAERDGEWSGLPIPIKDHRLTVEPNNPWRDKINELQDILYPSDKPEEPKDYTVINTWYSKSLRCDVYVWREATGKVIGRMVRHDTGIKASAWLGTLAACGVWNFDAECTAMDKLAFRRCRPTLAIKGNDDGELRTLCALCLHPIGYYTGTWAGSMVPTDEVIAHLLLMRGDEPMFWRRANQHEVTSPLAGV